MYCVIVEYGVRQVKSSEGHSADALQQSLLKERDRLQREIEELCEALAGKEQRLHHVLALLAEGAAAGVLPPRRARRRSASTATAKLLDMAEQVLRGRNREAMHYRDLADELIRGGAIIGGKDPAASLVSRMTQDKAQRFIRPTSKGFYALREDYPKARNVGVKRRRRE